MASVAWRVALCWVWIRARCHPSKCRRIEFWLFAPAKWSGSSYGFFFGEDVVAVLLTVDGADFLDAHTASDFDVLLHDALPVSVVAVSAFTLFSGICGATRFTGGTITFARFASLTAAASVACTKSVVALPTANTALSAMTTNAGPFAISDAQSQGENRVLSVSHRVQNAATLALKFRTL